MEDADSQLVILPEATTPVVTPPTNSGIPTLDARLDSHGKVQLSRDGSNLTCRKDTPGPSPDDIALFLHTSGTTSRPKGVPLTHANLLASLQNIGNTYALTPDDIAMVVMPLFHVHGLIGVALSTFSTGGSIVVPPRFSASRFWQEQSLTGATWYSAVPTIHQILLMRADDDSAPKESFRFIRSCSAALAPSVFGDLEARFGAPVLEAYGMTEASHQMSSNPLPPGDRRPGTVGAGTGVEIAVMDDDGRLLDTGESGEVVIKGPNVTLGYHNNPTANAEAFTNGWFRTGDQGLLDTGGVLTLTGRLKELINRGGEKISPLEIDAILLQHPCVAEAVCFGVPDVKYGELCKPRSCFRAPCPKATSGLSAAATSPTSKCPTVFTLSNLSPEPPQARFSVETYPPRLLAKQESSTRVSRFRLCMAKGYGYYSNPALLVSIFPYE